MSPVVTTSQVTISGTPAYPVQPVFVQPSPYGAPASNLEERVRALELENRALRAEFDAFKITSSTQIQAFSTIIEALRMQL